MTTSDRKLLDRTAELAQSVNVALDGGTAFLGDRQSADGAWPDYMLQPGTSDSWTTAYVGLCLLDVAEARGRTAEISDRLTRAAELVQSGMRADGGWGYNRATPVDCDSTSNAVLFLASLGITVPQGCYARIRRFQGRDGGFATFEPRFPGDSWGVSHPDVTPTALRALLSGISPAEAIITAGTQYSLEERQESGIWRSFWWTTALYGTAVNVTLLLDLNTAFDGSHTLNAVTRLSASISDPFRLSLALETVTMLGGDADAMCRQLLAMQQADGSWHAKHPNLRAPNGECLEPWQDFGFRGDVAVDQNHFLTTATALRSLSRLGSNGRGDQSLYGTRRKPGDGQQLSGHERAGSNDSQPYRSV